ncbi:armadillo-type protein [Peziza echinospora]|nr:armadillo-type protein [Peziza echinospora]
MQGGADSDVTTVSLDLAKLQATPEDQQEIFVMSFLRDLEKIVFRLDENGASAYQFYVKKELFRVLTLTTPAPTRVIRNQIGRCFAQIFKLGDRKLLYETINELVGIVNTNTGKAEKDLKGRHAAVHCLGDIYEVAGDSAIMTCTLICSSLVKLIKVAQNNCGLRSAIFRALGKIFRLVGGSADENIAREVWRQARNVASSDKGFTVQCNALECLEELMKDTPFFNTQQDYDKVLNVILKTMESPSTAVRRAAASCWATALNGAHGREEPNPFAKAAKKGSKKPGGLKRASTMPNEDDMEIPVPMSPAPKKNTPVLSFTLDEVLKQLSTHYTKSNVSHKLRAGVAQCYAELLKKIGPATVEANYGIIASHLLVDVLSCPVIGLNRFRLLMTRKYIKIILEDVVGQRLLGETAQLNAVKSLFNDIIKNYPQSLKDRHEPSKHTLAGALSAVASLMRSLGATVTGLQDIIRDGLLQVLQHPSYTVQVGTSWALKTFVLAVPAQLLPIITICMNNVNRELAQLTSRKSLSSDLFRRCTGFANGLAAVISTAPLQPLYASVDVTSRVLSLATSLLKSSGDHDLRVSSTQIQVAWILIGGLMSLGPNFVKIHLSQLLLLWKNALPKPLAKDSNLDRSPLELSFLSHVRECALGSILAFLEFNPKLLTTDVSKRISAMLQNSTLFLNTLPAKKTTDDVSQRLLPSIQLVDYDLMVRRRVLQCYNKLVKLSHAEALQANLLTIAVTFFADPDKYTPSSLSTVIASSAGNFESLWEIGDNYGYGVCDFVRGYDIGSYAYEVKEDDSKPTVSHWMTRQSPAARIDEVLHTPVLGSLEHDSVALYITDNSPTAFDPTPAPPATAVVNSAIDLFSILLPMQPPKVQESILEQLATFLASKSLDRDPGRKAAITVNVAVAILGSLKLVMNDQIPSANLSTPSVLKTIQEILHNFLLHPDPYVRNVAYEALGRLCSIGGNAFTGNEINYLRDTVVGNRDPNARAGCAVALGCIHSYVGGMAAGFHLKTIVGILMSLANDPHPSVHFWALDGLVRVIDSAGLTFSGFVSSTLGILARLYVADTHDIEVASIANSNLEIELPIIDIIARCIDALIGVLGPDLQDMAKARDLILTLIGQFMSEADPTVVLEGLRCTEHLIMFASSYVDMPAYVRRLQKELASPEWELRDVAVDGLYQLMKGDATKVASLADRGLEEGLWLALNNTPNHDGIRKIIANWVSQTALDDPRVWVDRCQTIMTKTFEKKSDKPEDGQTPQTGGGSGAMELNDEEAAGFATGAVVAGEKPAQAGAQEHLKWQVRTFAMVCLRDLLSIVGKEILANPEGRTEQRMIEKVADIIKMAFSASTSNVVELRLCGLRIIDQVLKMFGHTPDPDFAEATLLEQYQAQISSALTPAFAADSSPELASEAVNVCGGFIATGIVKDVERMGRILKLLVSALETFSSDTETITIGDLQGLSSNAQVMVKMAVFSAWAELQVASAEQKYLVDVVKPHITTLAPLWLSSLRDFARLRFEPDISNSGGGSVGGSIDAVYSALNRETLLKFYQDSWLNLVDAIASLIEQDSHFVFEALDGKMTSGSDTREAGHDINYRDEPVAFFFVLFGIAFEALVGRPGDNLATKEQTLEILLALKKILHPSVCGYAVYQEVIFSETMDLLDRLVLTEGLAVQLAIVDIARSLCVGHPTARNRSKALSNQGENLTEDIDQLFELTRIIVLVLAGVLPNLVDAKTPVRNALSEEATNLVRVSLDALVDAAEVFPSVIRMDLYACILHIFTTILGTGVCQAEIVPRALPIFKRFITIITKSGSGNDVDLVVNQVRGCLGNIVNILSNARLKAAELAIPAVKNCLTAATIVVTARTPLPPNDEQIPRLCDIILSSISSDDREVSKTALHCLRSLLLTPNPKTLCDKEIVRYILPRLVTYVTTNLDSGDLFRTQTQAGVCLIMTTFVKSLEVGEKRDIGLALLVPTLLKRAKEAENAVSASNYSGGAAGYRGSGIGGGGGSVSLYRETATRLLELVAWDQGVFKKVVANMGGAQRAFLEEVLRAGAGGGGGAGGGQEDGRGGGPLQQERPTIALKMFGA